MHFYKCTKHVGKVKGSMTHESFFKMLEKTISQFHPISRLKIPSEGEVVHRKSTCYALVTFLHFFYLIPWLPMNSTTSISWPFHVLSRLQWTMSQFFQNFQIPFYDFPWLLNKLTIFHDLKILESLKYPLKGRLSTGRVPVILLWLSYSFFHL